MRKITTKIFAILAILIVSLSYAQAKKPTIMVVPSDVWCNQNGYMMVFDNQGTTVKIPDYKRAFQENSDLLAVISKINGLMAERGFPLKNMESVVKTLESESAENAMLTSKSGAGVVESPIDKLKKVAKADIIIQLTWTLNSTGPKKSITFNLQGLDSYTDKQIATATGTGAPSFSVELPVLLEESVLAHIDNFNVSIQKHFDDMFENGREIIIRVKKFDSWTGDLEKEYDGKELSTILEDWMAANSVKGRYNTSDATENMMLFEQVRIPLFDANGKAIDARGFAKNLQDFLKKSPYVIPNKLMMKGLGQAVIVLGEK
ncbi:hypothetical protein FNW25_09300 [Flavobacterium franklandianum]|uniref:Uncharacterized protein n=1 Tax=Flavobacterium franklandianum TaxID=2594430 RepID=A0A553CU55_9FLAO|nr:DUF6175 family protein [Flavobacterium franklandianum]TRX24047.1 hypothetical protein FNW17_02400 [Flavobacterium franklandianum]TRX25381.1 hypothetical protein FNW25_09300 [Flavobacterium franklandianum]